MTTTEQLIADFLAAVRAMNPDPQRLMDLEAQIETSQTALDRATEEYALLTDLPAAKAKALAAFIALGEALNFSTPVEPGPVDPPPVDPPPTELTKFSTTKVTRWNYNDVYHPIEGAQPGKMPAGFAFLFDNVNPNADGELVHTLTELGGGAIKWEAEKKLAKTQGDYMVEATFDRIVPNVVYNPLWLYSEGSAEGGHEYDFEYMNGRLEYNLHNGSGGKRMRAVMKDLGGHRCRWQIIRRPMETVMKVTSLTDGWTDSLVIDPKFVADLAAQQPAPPNLRMPPDNIPMFPATELWRSRWNDWSGAWVPQTEPVRMTIHGYRFKP
jgi:hypothetical protein